MEIADNKLLELTERLSELAIGGAFAFGGQRGDFN